MELKDFIRETLVQITTGVKEAQEIIKDTGCFINPEGFHSGENLRSGFDKEYRHVQKVKMSIAINVIENNEKKAGIGVVASILSAGISTKNNDLNSTTNYIEFDIPISLPVMDVKNNK